MYVYSCNALSARFFTVDTALNSYFIIMIMLHKGYIWALWICGLLHDKFTLLYFNPVCPSWMIVLNLCAPNFGWYRYRYFWSSCLTNKSALLITGTTAFNLMRFCTDERFTKITIYIMQLHNIFSNTASHTHSHMLCTVKTANDSPKSGFSFFRDFPLSPWFLNLTRCCSERLVHKNGDLHDAVHNTGWPLSRPHEIPRLFQ